MLAYPEIRPYLFKIGPVQIRWYGLMYLIGFAASFYLVKFQLKRRRIELKGEVLENLYLSIIAGIIIGARLGYALFYNFSYYLSNPLEAFAVWHGGMSFHGGMIGAIIGGVIFCRHRKIDFLMVCDMVSVTVPVGLGLGRIGNFINGELFGRVTDVPWAMVFPTGGPLPRHPSQLYELSLEGVVLFSILWLLKDRLSAWRGGLTSVFIMLYGVFRIIVEFFREPDPQLGMLAGVITMGQLLSSFMVIAGVVGLTISLKARGRV
ncbi:MAG: prolipoprotein diacylglyceryl transferase [Candidatus Magnetominusculus sp. LBB02]|nr:prolipoprotein diacylglyceryl transferase [Candidatus Magnetominusculus sp. LBB02]